MIAGFFGWNEGKNRAFTASKAPLSNVSKLRQEYYQAKALSF